MARVYHRARHRRLLLTRRRGWVRTAAPTGVQFTSIDAVSQTRTATPQTVTSASFTPTAGAVLLVYCSSFRDDHTTAHNYGISNSANSITWNEIDESADILVASPNFWTRSIAWWGLVPESPVAMTITVDPNDSSTAVYASGLQVVEITGVDTVNPIVQHSSIQQENLSGDLNLTLTSEPTTRGVSAVYTGVTGSTATNVSWDAPPSDWSTLSGSDVVDVQNPTEVLVPTSSAPLASLDDVTHDFAATPGTAELGMTGLLIEWREAGSSVAVAVGQASETDTAQSVTPSPGAVTTAVGQASETDTAHAVTPVPGSVAVVVGQASETDTAQTVSPGSGGVSRAVGQASSTETAQAATAAPGAVTTAIGQATEADTAQSVTPGSGGSTVAVGQASETDTAQTVAAAPGSVSVAVNQASESDTAQVVTPVAGGAVLVGQASETDTAQSVTAAPGSVSVPVGQASETGTAQTVTPSTGGASVAVGQATEADTAQSVTASPGSVASTVGQASESDTAQVVTPDTSTGVAVGQAVEADTAQGLAIVPGSVVVSISQATEVDTAQQIAIVAAGFGTAGPIEVVSLRRQYRVVELRAMTRPVSLDR